jgi:hypothetical protein
MICTPKPIFLKSLSTGEKSHSALEMETQIEPIIMELGI